MNAFLSYTLSEDDPEIEAMHEMADSDNNEQERNVHFYVHASETLKRDEKKTLFVNFNHLTNFQW